MSRLHVLYCDNHLLVVDKPAGLPAVPDESGDESLLDQARAWVKESFQKPGEVFLGVVHRLDRPVSGVMLFARTSKAAGRMSEQWRLHKVRKFYWGVVAGGPEAEHGRVEQWLLKDPACNRVQAVAPPPPGARGEARLARTLWRVLARGGSRSLLELEPLSGRPHQLRVACLGLGCPLLGDLKYGAPEALPDRSVALHARRLEFVHPTRREGLEAEAPPADAPWWALARRLDAGGRPAGLSEGGRPAP